MTTWRAWLATLALLLPLASAGPATRPPETSVAFEVGPGEVALVDALVREGRAEWVLRVPEAGFVVVRTADPAALAAAIPLPAHVEAPGSAGVAWTPDDPLFAQQWHLPAVGAPAAWDLLRGPASARVAVVDSGADFSHPDLAGARLLRGSDHVENDADPTDRFGHGTHVTGTIAARAGNALGVAGVADVEVLIIRVIDAFGGGSCLDVAAGILEAAQGGAEVVNLSVYCSKDDPLLRLAVAYARARGALLVAAAGNLQQDDAARCVQFPARYEGVVAVGAIGMDLAVPPWSCRGPEVALVAPGVAVLATGLAGAYESRTGTSMSTPQVAAAAALVKAACRTLDAASIASILQGSAQDLGPPGRDEAHGHGLLQMDAALMQARAVASCPAGPGSGASLAR